MLGEKIKQLRKASGMTQEELAEKLNISRVAVSKWETERGIPNIDSLMQISKLFDVSLEELLSKGQLISIASEPIYKMISGVLDFMTVALFFLPLFADRTSEIIHSVPLLGINGISEIAKVLLESYVIIAVVFGFAESLLKKKELFFVSFVISVFGIAITALSNQPYACIYILFLLIAKLFFFFRKRYGK